MNKIKNMNVSNIQILKNTLATIFLTVGVVGFSLFFQVNNVLAVNTVTSSSYLDTNNDGTVDAIRLVMDENVTGCVYEAGDWTVNTATTMNIAITGLTCTGTDANLDISVSADANETGAGTDPVISYADVGTLGSITLASGAMTAKTNVTVVDAAKPVMTKVELLYYYSTSNNMIIYYSEPMKVSVNANGNAEVPVENIIGNNYVFSTITMGAMTTARTLTGIVSWGATNGGTVTNNSAIDNGLLLSASKTKLMIKFNYNPNGYFVPGGTAPGAALFTPLESPTGVTDLIGNPVNTLKTVTGTVTGGSWNLTPPTITNTFSCDTDLDGDIDTMTVQLSSSILDLSVNASGFEFDNNIVNDGVGEETVSVFDTNPNGCGGDNFNFPDDRRFSLKVTNGISGTDLAYLHYTSSGMRDLIGNRVLIGDALGTETDSAAPVMTSAIYLDNNEDGLLDQINTNWSENVLIDYAISEWSVTANDVTGLTIDGAPTGYGTPIINFPAVANSGVTGGVISPTISFNNPGGVGGNNVTDAIGNATSSFSNKTILDGANPVVISVLPALNSTKNTPIKMTFSEPMNTTWIEGTQFTTTPDLGTFSPVWSNGNKTVDFGLAPACPSSFTVATTEAQITSANSETLVTTGPQTGDWSASLTSCASSSQNVVSTPKTYSVTVNAPNGSETLQAGDTTDITWSTGGTGTTNYVNIEYSIDGGSTYTMIATAELNDGTYTWTVPSVASSQVMVRVSGTDLLNVVASDESDAMFSIGATTTTTPTPTTTPTDTTPTTTTPAVTEPSTGNTGASPVTGQQEEISVVNAGDYIRGTSLSAVYFVDENMIRHPFMNTRTFFTWQNSFDVVKTVTDATLTTLELGVPALPKHGTVLVKIQSDPKVYAIEFNEIQPFVPVLRWISSESVAIELYGTDWADYVIDVDVSLFSRFQFGTDIITAGDITVDRTIMKRRIDL